MLSVDNTIHYVISYPSNRLDGIPESMKYESRKKLYVRTKVQPFYYY